MASGVGVELAWSWRGVGFPRNLENRSATSMETELPDGLPTELPDGLPDGTAGRNYQMDYQTELPDGTTGWKRRSMVNSWNRHFG